MSAHTERKELARGVQLYKRASAICAPTATVHHTLEGAMEYPILGTTVLGLSTLGKGLRFRRNDLEQLFWQRHDLQVQSFRVKQAAVGAVVDFFAAAYTAFTHYPKVPFEWATLHTLVWLGLVCLDLFYLRLASKRPTSPTLKVVAVRWRCLCTRPAHAQVPPDCGCRRSRATTCSSTSCSYGTRIRAGACRTL
jgi:hypothetical protein